MRFTQGLLARVVKPAKPDFRSLSDEACVGTPTGSRPHGCNNRLSEGAQSDRQSTPRKAPMNSIIYIVGLVVIIGVILSYFGFR
jgi:hypothetical protein